MFEKYREQSKQPKNSPDKNSPDSIKDGAALLASGIEMIVKQAVAENLKEVTEEFAPLSKYLKENFGQIAQLATKQKQFSQQMDSKLSSLNMRIRELETKQKQAGYLLQNIERQQKQLISQSKLLENITKENNLLSEEHYRQHIIEPMARSLFPIFDFTNNARAHFCEAKPQNNSDAKQLTEAISIQLRQLFSIYQIEPISHKPGAEFDPHLMKPVKRISTDKKQLDRCVAKSLQTGFRWRKERILRHESVALLKYEEPEIQNVKQIDRR